MRKLILVIATVAISCTAPADGGFTVTQYNLNGSISSVVAAKSAIHNSSTWRGSPVTKQYSRIAFQHGLPPMTTAPHFQKSMTMFPSSVPTGSGIAVEIHGMIHISHATNWTFACGSDDGFEMRISGNGISESFSYSGERALDTTFKTISVPVAGEYAIELIYFDGCYSVEYDAAVLEVSIAEGEHTAFSSSFRLLRASSSMDTSHDVIFDANGGTGEMAGQVFEGNDRQKLSKSLYRKDGYVFQGWAVTANGEVVYKDEAEITVDSDMTLYAVWANPALALAAESADWSSGSITLRCEDSDTSGTAHEYTLEYKNSSGVWEEVDGAKNKLATKGQDASGQEVWVAKLTDPTFWSRLGGLPPVEYRVKDENGRVSTGCVTRNRHGLYVGVGEYEDGEKRGLPSLPFAPSDASKFKGIAEKHAKFSGRPVYANNDATIEAVDAALGDLVDCSQSGDICLFYITTHGGYDGKDGLICLYDGDYTHSALTEKVSRMADKGIAFIAVVGTCHAEAMLQMDFPNAAVVAAATMETLSTATFDEIFMYDGWEDCCAAPGPTMTFENLADYAIEKYNSLFGGIDFLDEDAEECYPYRMSATKNDVGGLLGKIVARTDCTSDFDIATKPSVVSGFSATTNDSEKISVSWNAVQGAERYYLFYGRLGNPQFLGYKVIEIDDGTSCAFGIDKDWVKESSKTAPARFMVKAYNVAGVSPAAVATGWRYRTFSIIFYTIDHERVDWDEPSFNRYKDDEVVKCVEYGDEYILKCLPKAKKPGYYLKGWYDLKDSEAVAGLTLNSDAMYHAEWREIAMPQIWLDEHVDIVEHSGGDLATAAAMTAANGTRTVDECYRLGIDPEDPEDDLKIAEFKMKDGKPEITLNHTKDGSGNSFEDRVKILGKAELSDAEWQEVPPEGNPAHRFFTVDVEMP